MPTRPSAAMSPICAMPATRVEKTSGAMIILIRRRNSAVTMLRYSAIVFSCAALAGVPSSIAALIAQPAISPSTSASRMKRVSFLAMRLPFPWRRPKPLSRSARQASQADASASARARRMAADKMCSQFGRDDPARRGARARCARRQPRRRVRASGRLILDCKGKLIVSGLGKSGHVGAQDRRDLRLDRDHRDLPAPRRSDPRRPRHGRQGRRRDPHLAERRDHRAGSR